MDHCARCRQKLVMLCGTWVHADGPGGDDPVSCPDGGRAVLCLDPRCPLHTGRG